MIDLGAITLNPGIESQNVLKNLQANLPNDVRIFTDQEFINYEKKYWATRTPIGFILNLMLIMGFVVGVVIVYQILYSNISTQMTAYATLKAIGDERESVLTLSHSHINKICTSLYSLTL